MHVVEAKEASDDEWEAEYQTSSGHDDRCKTAQSGGEQSHDSSFGNLSHLKVARPRLDKLKQQLP